MLESSQIVKVIIGFYHNDDDDDDDVQRFDVHLNTDKSQWIV